MGDPGTIVVVEDDPAVADLVDTYLRREGFRVLQATDGERALELVTTHNPRLVLLDVGLPGTLDGLDVCRRIRVDQPALPVMMLTARGDEIDRVLGLELGADDYVTKPFSPRELVARVKAVLRRAQQAVPPRPDVLEVGPVRIDTGARRVTVDGDPIDLTTREHDLLEALARHRGLVLSRRQILDQAWGPGWYGDERTVDVHVRQLRKKLGDDLPLTTVRGAGYRLD